MSDFNPDEDEDRDIECKQDEESEAETLGEEERIRLTPQQVELVPETYQRLTDSIEEFMEYQRSFVERQEAQLRTLSSNVSEIQWRQEQLNQRGFCRKSSWPRDSISDHPMMRSRVVPYTVRVRRC
jgi:hypothetical protein